MNNSSVTPNELVQEINNEVARVLMPANVLTGILMITGLIGNLMVVYYYGFKTKRNPTSVFIVALAVYDLIVCAFSMPHEFVFSSQFYTYSNKHLCKSASVIGHFAVLASGFTLTVIAMDRYRQICAFNRYQTTIKDVMKQSISIVTISFVFALPYIFLHGIVDAPLPMQYGIGLNGTSCLRLKSLGIYNFVLDLLYLFIFFLCVTIVVVLYFRIIKVLYIHRQNFGKSETTRNSCNPSKRIDRMTIKITVGMFVITAVAFLSFLPRLCLLVWRSIKGAREDQFLSGAGLLWFHIGRQSYMLNNSLNPWIYGIFNSQFRKFYYRKLCRCFKDPTPSTDTTRETSVSMLAEQTV